MRSVTGNEKPDSRDLVHKRIYCPHCGSRIIDAAEGTDSQVKAVGPFDPWPADYYTKCRVCKSQIGLKKING